MMISMVRPNICEKLGPICMIEGGPASSFILELMPNICENLHSCHFPQISGPVPEISGYSADIWRASRVIQRNGGATSRNFYVYVGANLAFSMTLANAVSSNNVFMRG
jgi:hypothetical protein